MQWIAVNAARKSFSGELAQKNGCIPFFIPLRRVAKTNLPKPEEYTHFVGPINTPQPSDWVDTCLRSGRAIVLVDGVDEVPLSKRSEVRRWVRQLVREYPQAQVIVTSRPSAVDEGWLDGQGFDGAEVNPMSLPLIQRFIDHWHHALIDTLHNMQEKADVDRHKREMKARVNADLKVRKLATSPLFCGALCALNRDRHANIPTTRLKLYKALYEMLLRRDPERGIETGLEYPSLSDEQKERLLEHLAYWMMESNLIVASRDAVYEPLRARLRDMGLGEYDLKKVCDLLIERSGVIREPVVDQIDFIHRTMQEYLATKAVIYEGKTRWLVGQASNDQWREVIIIAAGLADKKNATDLVAGLLVSGSQHTAQQHKMYLLAAACLETLMEPGEQLLSDIEKRLALLIPPTTMEQAKTIAVAGDLAVPHLTLKAAFSESEAAACVRALALINTDASFYALKSYLVERRPVVINELFAAADAFQRDRYFEEILAPLKLTKLTLDVVEALNGFDRLTTLSYLHIRDCEQVEDLGPLASLHKLTSLSLGRMERVRDLGPLASLHKLTSLNLEGLESVEDLGPLASLHGLTSLHLTSLQLVEDLGPLASLHGLTSLNLERLPRVESLGPLASLHLNRLELVLLVRVEDLVPLALLRTLTSLKLVFLEQVKDLGPLASLRTLTSLRVDGSLYVDDLGPLASLDGLTALWLGGIQRVEDLGPLASLRRLTSLSLERLPRVVGLEPLASLRGLTSLKLGRMKRVRDLGPLASLHGLTSLNLERLPMAHDLSPLASFRELPSLHLELLGRVVDPNAV